LPDFFYKKGRLLQAPLFYFHDSYSYLYLSEEF
jgi:hypothetical protein